MLDARHRGRVTLVGDDQPDGLAVRGDEHLQAAFEVGVLEHLRRQVEGVVVFGFVEVIAHQRRALRQFLLVGLDACHRAVRGHHEIAHRLHGFDSRRQRRQHLRHQLIETIETPGHNLQFVGELIDPVKSVEDRAKRPTTRNVEAVFFPVEVAANRPEVVIEVGDVVPQLVGGVHDVVRLSDDVVGGGRELLHDLVHVLHVGDGLAQLVGLLEHLRGVVVLNLGRLQGARVLHGDLERDRTVFDRRPQRPGDGLDPLDAMQVEHALGDPVDDEHVRRVTQIVIGLQHQQLGIHPGLGEVPLGRLHRDVSGHVGGRELLVVVLRHVGQQTDEADDRDRQRHDDDGHGPADYGRADLAPAPRRELPLSIEQTEPGPHGQDRRRQRQRRCHDHQKRDSAGQTHRIEVRQRAHGQAHTRTRDRQPRTQDHVRHAMIGRVKRIFGALTRRPGFLISAQQEDHVVGSRGDGEHRDHAHRIRRQTDDVQVAGGGRDALRRKEFDTNNHQRQHRGHDRAVDDQQHYQDDADRHQRHQLEALVPRDADVGIQHGVAGHVGLHPWRRRHRGDDVAHGGHRLLTGPGALGADQEDLYIGGLAVRALRARSGQRVTPEVLDVLHVPPVRMELRDDLVVELVRAVAELVLPLQDHHRRGIRIELLEHVTDVHHAVKCRRVLRRQRHRMLVRDGVQRRSQHAQTYRDEHPENDDRDRQDVDQPGDDRATLRGVRVAHTDFTRQ